MSKVISISGSYVQDQRHSKVTERYNPIQASSVGQAMTNHGLTLASLSTGRARHEDKANFQRTLSRYRGPSIGDGVNLDIIYDSKHMGRGTDRILLGIYRMVCTNGLFVGSNFFSHAIRHSGDTYANLNEGIGAALAIQSQLADTVKRMQGIQLDAGQREALALEAVKLLTPSDALQVRHRLLKPIALPNGTTRDGDSDLWTTYNLIQENSVKGNNVAYVSKSTDSFGRDNLRNMATRAIKPNSGKDAAFNQALFDAALKLAA